MLATDPATSPQFLLQYTRSAGQHWAEEKGVPFSIVNEGSISFVDSFIQIIT